jgi:hypothetical protein
VPKSENHKGRARAPGRRPKKDKPSRYDRIRHLILDAIAKQDIEALCREASKKNQLGLLKMAISLIPKEARDEVPGLADLAAALDKADKRDG